MLCNNNNNNNNNNNIIIIIIIKANEWFRGKLSAH